MEGPVNWLWQSWLMAGFVWLVVRSRSVSASTRYLLWWMTIVAIVAMFLAPFCLALLSTDVESFSFSPGTRSSPWLTLPRLPVWLTRLVLAGWLVVTCLSLVRLAAARRHVDRLKRRAVGLSTAREKELRTWMSLRDRGRPVSLVVSDDVPTASVLGFRRPVIALPRGQIERLSDEELDLIVVHEYAHVQRRDDYAFLAQLAIRAALGLNPAVWWIDRSLTVEREVACDDWVVALTGLRTRYAACLANLAGTSISPTAPAVAPGVALGRPELTIRITRLLDKSRNGSRSSSIKALTLTGAALVCLMPGLLVLAPVIVHTPATAERSTGVGLERGAQLALALTLPVLDEGSGDRETTFAAPESPRRSEGRQVGGTRTSIATAVTPSTTMSVPDPRNRDSLPTSLEDTDIVLNADSEPDTPVTLVAVQVPDAHTWSAPAPFVRVTREQSEKDPRGESVVKRGQRPWRAASDAGVVIGARTRKAALATAGVFSRLGSSVAQSF